MTSVSRLSLRTSLWAALVLALPLGALAAETSTSVAVVYGVSVGGLGVATLNLDATINDQSYSLSGTGQVTGIASAVAPTSGSSRSNGAFSGARTLSGGFNHSESSRDRKVSIELDMRNGDVQRVAVAPAADRDPKRVPVQPAHMRDVLDPLSAIVVRMPGEGPLVSERACNRSVPIFNGWSRFDIALSYVGTREVQNEGSYSGPVVVCEARYRPVSGHRPSKASTQRAEQARVEVWLAPVEGTRVLLPYRAALDTAFGRGILQARRFEISNKGERRAAAN